MTGPGDFCAPGHFLVELPLEEGEGWQAGRPSAQASGHADVGLASYAGPDLGPRPRTGQTNVLLPRSLHSGRGRAGSAQRNEHAAQTIPDSSRRHVTPSGAWTLPRAGAARQEHPSVA